LSKVKVRNFRCFIEEIEVDFEDVTVIIGKNDSGKTTILEALDLFFNDKNPDKDDASKNGNASDITITCEFTDISDEVVIDEDYTTTLKSEYLLNQEGHLEIGKTFNGSLQNPKLSNIYALANHPNVENAKDLLQLNNVELKKRATELDCSLNGVDKRVNAVIREAIRDKIGKENLELTLSQVPLDRNDGQKIWNELKKNLPAFFLFKSDRTGTDQDTEAQDPLKIAVREAIEYKKKELQDITNFVKTRVNEIANLTLEKLKEMNPELASNLKPEFSPQKWDTLFKTSISGDDDIPINKRGSGVRRLILFSFLRARAELTVRDENNASLIYAIEEPETGQHPHNQRILMRTLSNLSSEAQVIVSTHTPMLARAFPDGSIRYIKVLENSKREILKGGNANNEEIVNSLGILPDNNVKLFIEVEGVNDVNFLQGISKILHTANPKIPDLGQMEIDGEIIFIPMGGSNLAQWSNRLAKLNRPEFSLFDRDYPPPKKPKSQDNVDEVNKRDNCKAVLTQKKEIENYIHKDAIIEAYKKENINLDIKSNFDSFDDVPFKIAQLVYEVQNGEKPWDKLGEKDQKKKSDKAKKTLCKKAVEYMNETQLNEVDPQGEVISWLNEIQRLLNTV
jgi:putative ATP-dependent endonuclease of OLD family